MKLNSKLIILYFISYLLIPLVLVELVAQIVYADKVRMKGYFVRYFTSITPSSLRGGNKSIRLNQSTLYSRDGFKSSKNIKFRTDSFGTIIPSTLEKVIKDKGEKYYIFCGGSTTESGYIPEGSRHVDLFEINKGINSVNAGNSGTDLYGCIKTLDYLINKVGMSNKPRKIIISTNTNTLMSFLKTYKVKEKERLAKNAKYAVRDKYLPGSYIVLAKLKKAFIFNSEIWKNTIKEKYQSKIKGYNKYTNYEKALLMGCCYGPSQVNNNNDQIYEWESKKNLKNYLSYISKGFTELNKFSSKYSLSKDNIVVFIEPNSFRYKKIGAKYDYRQNLYNKNLEPYSYKESGNIIAKYDNIYANEGIRLGFNVIISPPNLLSGNDFYDAVHMTPSGAKKLSSYLTKRI